MHPWTLATAIWAVTAVPLIALAWVERVRTDDELAAFLGEANGRAEYAAFWLAVKCLTFVQDFGARGLAGVAVGSFVVVAVPLAWAIGWVTH